jgi:undecaprenyl-diphosphatase
MWEQLNALDTAVLLTLNGWHAPWADGFFLVVTGRFIWIPFYAFLAWKLYRSRPSGLLVRLLVVALMITASDQLASGVIKPLVERPRPCHVEALEGRLHLVNGNCGGPFGFVSSHAANTFALATFLWLLFRKRYGQSGWAWLFAWAVLVSYSRIYLGVHYPGDLICAAVLGAFIGWLAYRTLNRIEHEPTNAVE